MTLPEVQMPSGILPFTAADHVITPEALYVQIDRQAGHTRSRRKFRSVPTIVNTSFEVTQAQLETFFDWHEGALIAGSLPFAANIAKIGPGTEWWRAFILSYTVEHSEGSHKTVKVQLKLTGLPFAGGPVSGTLAVEFVAALVTSTDPLLSSDLVCEFFATLETAADLGPTLSAEFFGRLQTQVDAGPANPSLDVEFLCELQTITGAEPAVAFDVEFAAALVTASFVDMDLAVEFTAGTVASVASPSFVVSVPPFTQYASLVSGVASAGVDVLNNGEIRSQANAGGWELRGNWWQPTQPNIGDTYWVRMTHLTGAAFFPTWAVGTWHQLNRNYRWYLNRDTLGVSTLTARIEVGLDPDGTYVLSTCDFTLTAEITT